MSDSVIHDFQERLRWSAELSDEPSWVAFYQRVWPDALAVVRVDKDSAFQRWGVDRLILRGNGRQETVDEKKRSKNYDDFLIEEWSDLAQRKVGWTLDPSKRCDWIAYCNPQLKSCVLLPFDLLRRTCKANLVRWKRPDNKNRRDVPNNGWVTRNWVVSWRVLFDGMEREMRLRYESGESPLPAPRDDGKQLTFEWFRA